MFTIFGANGNTGSIVANRLLDAGKRVRVVARDASKLEALRARGADVLTADVLDAGQVTAALAGAEAAYLLIPPDLQSSDVIARAKKISANYAAGIRANHVKNVVLLSSVGADLPAGTGPIVTAHHAEQALASSGAIVTTIRAAYFMENLLNNAHPIKNDGVLPVFGGGETYPFPMVATRDIGELAAEQLLAAPTAPRVIELSGPKEYSFTDAAAAAAEIVGRPVKAVAVPMDQLVPTYTSFGMSKHMAELFREMLEAFGSGRAHFNGTNARRGKVTLPELLRAGLS